MNINAINLARLALAGLSDAERSALLGELSPKGNDRILRRKDVAQILGRSCRTVDLWARRGLIHRVQMPGLSRGSGFLESEVRALLRNVRSEP